MLEEGHSKDNFKKWVERWVEKHDSRHDRNFWMKTLHIISPVTSFRLRAAIYKWSLPEWRYVHSNWLVMVGSCGIILVTSDNNTGITLLICKLYSTSVLHQFNVVEKRFFFFLRTVGLARMTVNCGCVYAISAYFLYAQLKFTGIHFIFILMHPATSFQDTYSDWCLWGYIFWRLLALVTYVTEVKLWYHLEWTQHTLELAQRFL